MHNKWKSDADKMLEELDSFRTGYWNNPPCKTKNGRPCPTNCKHYKLARKAMFSERVDELLARKSFVGALAQDMAFSSRKEDSP